MSTLIHTLNQGSNYNLDIDIDDIGKMSIAFSQHNDIVVVEKSFIPELISTLQNFEAKLITSEIKRD
jgi:hypothetical protein